MQALAQKSLRLTLQPLKSCRLIRRTFQQPRGGFRTRHQAVFNSKHAVALKRQGFSLPVTILYVET
jgi:hypothetical protein